MATRKIPAIPFYQNRYEMYIAIMDGYDLVLYTLVDEWEETNPEGYQRRIYISHARSFARFIRNKMYSPTSIVLSLRPKYSDYFYYEDGYIYFDTHIRFFIIDGQHRVEGLRILYNKHDELGVLALDIQFPVIIIPVDNKLEEATQFIVINRRRKTVKVDLAERYISNTFGKIIKTGKADLLVVLPELLGKGPKYKLGIEIIDALNNDPKSIWYRKIAIPNKSRKNTTISQHGFLDSLKPLLNFNDELNLSLDELIKLMNIYWDAVTEIMPMIRQYPNKYVIFKTTGTTVFNGVLPFILKFLIQKHRHIKLNKNTFYRIFNELKSQNSKFMEEKEWRASSSTDPGGFFSTLGTSKKVFKHLVNSLEIELERVLAVTS